MHTSRRSKPAVAVVAAALLAAAALSPRAASADGESVPASRPGITLGGRATYDRPKDADDGTLNGGAQLRLHLTQVVAVEGSVDYRQSKFGGTTVDAYPVQASLLLYLAPSWIVSPYILGGVGWYHTHVRGPNGTSTDRYGPHAGAGLEIALAKHWTIDGSYRYLWAQDLTAPTTTSPAGKNFSDHGYMLTAALNYRF
ncbi:MAG TPA: porin family protein [Elusimicrobiota bacterium]|jgi:opacity protein-like surface antigen|nr:porin family protein [Elusimicrobiota bacterium]